MPLDAAPPTIKIDSGIPLPGYGVGARKKGGNIDAMRTMEVGQSFVFRPRSEATSLEMQRNSAFRMSRNECPGKKYATRILTEDGIRVVRVWRTA